MNIISIQVEMYLSRLVTSKAKTTNIDVFHYKEYNTAKGLKCNLIKKTGWIIWDIIIVTKIGAQ